MVIVVKNPLANAGDTERRVQSLGGEDPLGRKWGRSSPGRSPGEGNGTPLQYSCLENSMNIGAW